MQIEIEVVRFGDRSHVKATIEAETAVDAATAAKVCRSIAEVFEADTWDGGVRIAGVLSVAVRGPMEVSGGARKGA